MTALGDLVSLQRGTTYKSALLGGDGPVLLGLASIARNGGFRADSLRNYGGDSPDKLLVRPGELFASLKDVTQSADLLGSVARVPLDGPVGRLTQDTVRLDIISDQVDPAYLYLALLTPQYREHCRAHATGTTNLGLPREDFLAYDIPLPPLADQRRIAQVFRDLDQLVEHNEILARAADELWRVRMRLARSSATEPVPLSSLASFVNGKNFTKDADGNGRPVIRTPEVRKGPNSSTIRTTIEAASDNLAHAGDILFVWSGSLMTARWTWQTGLVNQHIFKVVPKPGTPDWIAMWAVEELMEAFLGLAADKATTMGHIKRADLDRAVSLPPRGRWEELDAVIRPLWDASLALRIECQDLRATRDKLLPLLLSGKVKVNDAEGLVA